jgi:hypothetical protein
VGEDELGWLYSSIPPPMAITVVVSPSRTGSSGSFSYDDSPVQGPGPRHRATTAPCLCCSLCVPSRGKIRLAGDQCGKDDPWPSHELAAAGLKEVGRGVD